MKFKKLQNILIQIDKLDLTRTDKDRMVRLLINNVSTSDVDIARIIRPAILLIWTISIISIIIGSLLFEVTTQTTTIIEIWMPLISTILVTLYASYFGGRSIEKMTAIKNSGQPNKVDNPDL